MQFQDWNRTRYQVGSLICHKNETNSKFETVYKLFTIVYIFALNQMFIKILLFGMDRITDQVSLGNLNDTIFFLSPPFFLDQTNSKLYRPMCNYSVVSSLLWHFFIIFVSFSFQVVEYEGSNHIRNPEMQRVLLTHEVICR